MLFRLELANLRGGDWLPGSRSEGAEAASQRPDEPRMVHVSLVSHTAGVGINLIRDHRVSDTKTAPEAGLNPQKARVRRQRLQLEHISTPRTSRTFPPSQTAVGHHRTNAYASPPPPSSAALSSPRNAALARVAPLSTVKLCLLPLQSLSLLLHRLLLVLTLRRQPVSSCAPAPSSTVSVGSGCRLGQRTANSRSCTS